MRPPMKNYLTPTMRPIKLMSVMGAMMIGTSLLTGCANMMHRLGHMPIQPLHSKACLTAPVLITNLKKDDHQRQYQLPDGHTCLEINNYEQVQKPESA